ncbi:MAG: glycine cleavage system protein GcvH [Chlamydiia bacterium]|nr:glycine cleavage system protein GcvH [Chlamydiia bacterium]
MKYTESHEWIDSEGTVGVTEYAQKELGDIVYVELPKVGSSVNAGDEVVVLESTKAAADVYAPVSGKIVAVNDVLTDECELVNLSPQEKGWLYRIELSNPQELDKLLTEEQYQKIIT